MTQEKSFQAISGWSILWLNLLLLFGGFIAGIMLGRAESFAALPCYLVAFGTLLSTRGHFTLQPNEACVLSLFGPYVGTVRDSGFFWANPFYARRKISLRARNLEGAKLKVNDKQGNPIEIAIVVVWHVADTAHACYDVDNYENFVRIQSETAVRHLANAYAYDHGEEHEVTLRSGVDEVSTALCNELRERLAQAGVEVVEARIMHLAYASEIATVMLRRQQAEAVIAARQKIVHGAVSMVQMALIELEEKKVVTLEPDQRARLVGNLLTVLCGEIEVHPVINAGQS
ncbi:MAG TPA: SPFH domain-containing protein [Pirellulales bacterium]|jgi:regulator of protease activity HflC (stomatin/prohibitin superfamily)|nr:SPFH domain-containing protein [Pirellulales bacterium]